MKQAVAIVLLGLIRLAFPGVEFQASCYAQSNVSPDKKESARTAPFNRLAAWGQQDMRDELPVAFVYKLLRSESLPTIQEGIRAARTHPNRHLFAADLKRIITEKSDLNILRMATYSLPEIESHPDVSWLESLLISDRPPAGILQSKRLALIESIRLYKSPEHADALLKRLYTSPDPQVRLSVTVACSERELTETSSEIFCNAFQSNEFVNFAIFDHFIDGGKLRHQAARISRNDPTT